MARSPVTKVIESFNALTEEQKKLCLDFIAPEPEPQPEAPAKKTRKKRAVRSAHAESLSAVIAKTPKAETDVPCAAHVPGLDIPCGERADSLIHDPQGGYASYHPFSLVAPIATPKSSRRSRSTKASESSTPNSETSSEGALAVGAGGN